MVGVLKNKSHGRVCQTAKAFLKATFGPYKLLSLLKDKAIIMCWVKSRFQKHMRSKNTFVSQFTKQWSQFISQKISSEYEKGKTSRTAKIFVSTPSWYIKQMAEREFDRALERLNFSGRPFPKRVNWIDHEFDNVKKRRLPIAVERLNLSEGTPSMLDRSPEAKHTIDSNQLPGDKLFTLMQMTASSLVKSKKIKKSADSSKKSMKKKQPKKKVQSKMLSSKTFTFRPLAKNSPSVMDPNSEMAEKPIVSPKKVSSPPEKESPRNSRASVSPKKKKLALSFAHLQQCFDKILNPRLRLKTVFLAALFLAKVKLSLENKSYNVKLVLSRKLQPKPRRLIKVKCQTDTATFEQYILALGSKMITNSKLSK